MPCVFSCGLWAGRLFEMVDSWLVGIAEMLMTAVEVKVVGVVVVVLE